MYIYIYIGNYNNPSAHLGHIFFVRDVFGNKNTQCMKLLCNRHMFFELQKE